ncbi:hypothetical protein [Sphingomonas glacialis]|uniref:hypothetical protein n=1 Tax=Sphingomonas glacialis TaxID=658225 RepID=UPI00167A5B7F|nr:hypothetical protein [Sphingomonas glacialis]
MSPATELPAYVSNLPAKMTGRNKLALPLTSGLTNGMNSGEQIKRFPKPAAFNTPLKA